MKASTAFQSGFHHAGDPASHRPWIHYIARSGYAARGVVYLLIGGLAVLSALGHGGETGDQKDALQSLLSAPAGAILLAILAIGLLCFASWRFIQAAFDTDKHGSDAKGWIKRGALVVSSITHVALALAAARIAWGNNDGGGDGTQSWTAWLLSQPFGRWLVGLVGVAIIGAGVAHVVKAVKKSYEKHLDIDPQWRDKLRPVFMAGLIARGIVFGMIGSFFIYAAWTYDASNAGGLQAVFDEVRSHQFGGAMLLALSVGLFAFGIYGLAQARWRRVTTD